MSRRTTVVVLIPTLLVLVSLAAGQNPPASDPQAVPYAAQSISAMTGGMIVSDVTLTGTATWVAGSDYETGSATLQAKGIAESRIDLALSETPRSEVRSASGRTPRGAWSLGNSPLHLYAQHNCWSDPVWFFPALSSLTQTLRSQFVISYIGQERHNGVNTHHVQVSQPSPNSNTRIARLTVMEFYLDPTSFLPRAMAFNTHADADMNTDISVEIKFSNYQRVNGVQIPFHIQRLVNGSLNLDVVLTSAELNTGISDSVFAISQ